MNAGEQNHQNRSILLDCGPEIIQNIYSFMPLREALVVRQTCRSLNTGTDAFRYSQLISKRIAFASTSFLASTGFTSANESSIGYLLRQRLTLCNLSHNDKLRALLLNESLKDADRLLEHLVEYSETDNGEAVTILLQDGRCNANVSMLEELLQKEFVSMAAALQENAAVKEGIRMCHTCSVNIGCYDCASRDECDCKMLARCTSGKDKELRDCRACVLAKGRLCKGCGCYVCPGCCRRGRFHRCEACQAIFCLDRESDECHRNAGACKECNRRVCFACSSEVDQYDGTRRCKRTSCCTVLAIGTQRY